MPVLLISKDPFVEAMASMSETEQATNWPVRRPLLGTIPKKNAFAYISLYYSSGTGSDLTPISIEDSSGVGSGTEQGYSNSNHNFFLTSVDIKRQEKTQIIETFGQEYAFFFGEQAQFINFGGLLINTADFNWKNEWLRNYDKFLRGTRCVEMKSRVLVGFDDVVVSGYIVNTAVNMSAESPYVCPFQFGMLVTDYVDLTVGWGKDDGVRNASQARTYGEGNGATYGGPLALRGAHAEYMTEPTKEFKRTDFDTATGAPKVITTTQPDDLPGSIDYENSAYWLGGGKGHTPESGIRELSVQSYMQQNNVDRITAIRAHSSSPGEMSLGKRSDNSDGIATALGGGIVGFCGVIDDEKTSG